jgi:hypothetical protein
MSTAWDECYALMNETSSTKFLRLKSGESARIVFLDPPVPRKLVWTGTAYEAFDEGNPAHRAGKVTARFGFNVYDLDQETVRIFEANSPCMGTIIEVRDKYTFDTVFEVKRNGEGLDTSYSVLFEDKVSPALRAAIAAAPVHDIRAAWAAPPTEAPASPATTARPAAPAPTARPTATAGGPRNTMLGRSAAPTPQAPAEPAISNEDFDVLRERLQALGSEAVEVFLRTMGIKRVRELPLSKLTAACVWLDNQEVDPWA